MKLAVTFKDLIAWQRVYELTLLIYKHTQSFPKDEIFGLTSQIRRASISVVANIAEGFKKFSKKEKIRFCKIAECSLEEVKCHSMLSKDLGYINSEHYEKLKNLEDRTGQLLSKWIQSQK